MFASTRIHCLLLALPAYDCCPPMNSISTSYEEGGDQPQGGGGCAAWRARVCAWRAGGDGWAVSRRPGGCDGGPRQAWQVCISSYTCFSRLVHTSTVMGNVDVVAGNTRGCYNCWCMLPATCIVSCAPLADRVDTAGDSRAINMC
jgi:hypothetical protein